MQNLDLWEKFRTVPDTAKKPIPAGKLKGKTDINPVWRIKTLTAEFGPCGIGWQAPIVRTWTEPGANGEVAAFVEINLLIKVDGAWSSAINATGGSMLVQTEKGHLVTNDEAYKMAYTDALSVACKMLGIGADVYWDADTTKYGAAAPGDAPPVVPEATTITETQKAMLKKLYTEEEIRKSLAAKGLDSLDGMTRAEASAAIEKRKKNG